MSDAKVAVDPREADARALDLLRRAAGPRGFRASAADHPHYRRVWTRDGAIAAIAAVASAEGDLIDAATRTLDTVAGAAGSHGEIPSNVGDAAGDVSFGGLAGRVDAPLWYAVAASVVGAVDPAVARRHGPAVGRALDLVATWELNLRGLVHVPLAGTWADEYVGSGYLLEVQALRLHALRTAILPDGSPGPDPARAAVAARLERLIERDYWADPATRDDPDHYHPNAYRAVARRAGRHWLAGFDAAGYATRFDALANILAVGLGIGGADRARRVRSHVERLSGGGLLPAFAPVITADDPDWRLLRLNHRAAFRNRPGAYHNGGRWAWLTGLWAAAIASTDPAAARRHADAIDAANSLGMRGRAGGWAFAEFHDARIGRPGGVPAVTWSAAGAVIARRAIAGVPIFPTPS
jgi:hypothetical protein